MKIDAQIKFIQDVPTCGIHKGDCTIVLVDCDYVEENHEDIGYWLDEELCRKYQVPLYRDIHYAIFNEDELTCEIGRFALHHRPHLESDNRLDEDLRDCKQALRHPS
jgi:hypothetical protein